MSKETGRNMNPDRDVDTEQSVNVRDYNRRTFLKSTSLALGVSFGFSKIFAEDNMKSGFIDCHSHVWTDDIELYPLQGTQTAADLKPRTFTPEELLAIAEPVGVSRVVLIQHTVYHDKDNSYLVDTIKHFPGRFSGVACVEPRSENLSDSLVSLHDSGCRGLRIRPGDGGVKLWSDSEGMKEMWRRGPEIGLAMCPLINPEYLPEVDRMCQSFPETTVVIDHFARIGIDGTIRQSDLDNLLQLARFSNVFVKVSAFYALGEKQPPHRELVPMIRQLYDKFGPQRLMWGSDCPYQLTSPNNYNDSLALITDRIDFLSADDKDWILKKSAESVFFSN